MAALTTFLSRLVPRAMGVADPVARQALIDSAIEFCERTHIVKVVTDPVNAVAGQPNYAPVLDAELAVVALSRAWYLDTPIGPVADDDIRSPLAYFADVGNGEVEAGTGDPSVSFWYDNEVWVYPRPAENKAEALTFKLAVKPAITATTVPDELLNNWREAIVDGALGRVLDMRGTNHYDPQAALKAADRFNTAVGRAKLLARTGRARGEQRVTMRPFA